MAANQADFTLTFRRLCDEAADPEPQQSARSLFGDPSSFDEWRVRWRQQLADEEGDAPVLMCAVNPVFVPRNHRVEEALVAATTNGDFAPFRTLLSVLSHPYDDQPGFEHYADPPTPDQVVTQTFCGT